MAHNQKQDADADSAAAAADDDENPENLLLVHLAARCYSS
jgi:hypothetical protein